MLTGTLFCHKSNMCLRKVHFLHFSSKKVLGYEYVKVYLLIFIIFLQCKKDENFRKHMLLLWQNNVPVSIEVLLCSNCRVSQQKVRSVEFSTIPEPGSILLEQWTVSIQTKSKSLRGQHLITSHGLFQAVRSYLHFSQLSAWYSSSR